MTAGTGRSGVGQLTPPRSGFERTRSDAEFRGGDAGRVSLAGGMEMERLLGAIAAMTTLVAEESEAISRGGAKEVEKYYERKAQAFVGLNRQMHASRACLTDVAVGRAIAALHNALTANRRKLKCQMEAVSEVTQLVIRAIESEQSDGTYDAPRRGRSPAPMYGSD